MAYLGDADPAAQVRDVLVEVDGEPVLEHYVDADAEDFFDVRSMTKSVVSAVAGIAIEEGHLDGVDQTLAELLPERADAMSPAVAAVTLEQVLTHTPALRLLQRRQPPALGDPRPGHGPAAARLRGRAAPRPPRRPPGPGVRAGRRARSGRGGYGRLYDEYMASGFARPRDPQNVHDGASYMRLRPADLLALGRLYADEARVGDEQVVPADWVTASTGSHVDTRDFLPDYGYHWWVTDAQDHDAFVAFGFGGQMVEVVPELDLVVAVVTEVDDRDPAQPTKRFERSEAAYLVEVAVLPHLPSR